MGSLSLSLSLSLSQVLAEQEGAVKERIASLQEANSDAKMDPVQVGKLEKVVQKHKKGERK